MRGAWAGPGADLAHEAGDDEDEADEEEQRPLPQRVQVVLEHEDCAGRRVREAGVAAAVTGVQPAGSQPRSAPGSWLRPTRVTAPPSRPRAAPLGCCWVNG